MSKPASEEKANVTFLADETRENKSQSGAEKSPLSNLLDEAGKQVKDSKDGKSDKEESIVRIEIEIPAKGFNTERNGSEKSSRSRIVAIKHIHYRDAQGNERVEDQRVEFEVSQGDVEQEQNKNKDKDKNGKEDEKGPEQKDKLSDRKGSKGNDGREENSSAEVNRSSDKSNERSSEKAKKFNPVSLAFAAVGAVSDFFSSIITGKNRLYTLEKIDAFKGRVTLEVYEDGEEREIENERGRGNKGVDESQNEGILLSAAKSAAQKVASTMSGVIISTEPHAAGDNPEHGMTGVSATSRVSKGVNQESSQRV